MKKIISFLIIAVLVQAISCYKNPASGRSQLMLLSYEQEKSLGKGARKDVERQFGGVVKDKKLNAYVDSVGQKIAATIRKKVESKNSDQEVDYEFKVLNSKIINAFTLPGGYIYITRGLLSKLEDESQLAAVLGHEAGHAVGRHSAEQLSKQITMGTLLSAGVSYTASRDTKQARKNAAKISTVGNVAGGLIMLGFSRDDEAEADELGTKFIYNTGYDPRGMIGVLKILQKENKGGESEVMEIFQTHPNTKRRIADVDKEIRKKYSNLDKDNLIVGVESFRNGTATLREHYVMYDRADKARREGKAGDVNTALDYINEAIEENDDDASLYVQRAELYDKIGDYKKAEKDYAKALELDEENFDALLGLGIIKARNNKYEEAANLLEQAVGILPGNAEGHFWLGEVYGELNRKSDAREEFSAVLEIAQASPNDNVAKEYAKMVREKGIELPQSETKPAKKKKSKR